MCGPKTAACCTILSTWGLVQLGITGVFMYLGSPALIEDIPLQEDRCEITRMCLCLGMYPVFVVLSCRHFNCSCRITAMPRNKESRQIHAPHITHPKIKLQIWYQLIVGIYIQSNNVIAIFRQDWSESEWSNKMQIGYQQSALNCWWDTALCRLLSNDGNGNSGPPVTGGQNMGMVGVVERLWPDSELFTLKLKLIYLIKNS